MQTKRNKWPKYLIMVLILVAPIFALGCDKDETNNSVALFSFGPSPALRGGEIRFIGTNFSSVTAIVFPSIEKGGNIEVTDIEKVNEREIKVQIPQEAGVGILTLKTSQGDIKTITPLTYSEPIKIESVVPKTVKAGETLTIRGDYLNLIKEVVFFENVVVKSDDFLPGQSRKRLQLIVPPEAKTGKIIVSNGEEIPIEVYSKEDIQVALPVFTQFSPKTVKPGNEIIITGKDLDLVAAVAFGGDKNVTTLSLNENATQLKVLAPKEIHDGEIKLVTKSGMEIISAKPLITLVPSDLKVLPAVVKNGGEITITGKNLDLVSLIEFNDLKAKIISHAENEIKLEVPQTAASNHATLITFSNKKVETSAFAYVKPVVSAFNPITLMAGSDVTIIGSDLDLIRKIQFPSASKEVEVEPASSTSFSIAVPTDATSGNPIFITVNETEITSPIALTITEADIPVISQIPSSAKPGERLIIEGSKLNLVETVIFENNVKATQFGTRSATRLEVYIPENAARGANEMKLITFNGKIVKESINIMATDPILPTTLILTNFNGSGNSQSTWGTPFKFGVPSIPLDGTQCMIGKASVSGWTWSWAANWGALPALSDPNKYVFKLDICITKSVPKGVSAGMCFRGWDNSISLGNIFEKSTNGNWITLTFNLNPDNAINGAGDYGFYLSCSETVDLSGVYIDNFRFDLK